jgi:NADH-quinone oxidoreductase subunit G
VWFLQDVPGICTGCANGCNVHIGVANNKVHRYQPRRNDDVNDTWICDAGRMSYTQIGAADRIRHCLVRGELGVPEATSLADAVRRAAELLRAAVDAHGSGSVAGIASAHCANEDLFVFQRFLSALGAGTSGVSVVRGESDALLVKAEKAPNAAGARAIGFPDSGSLVERIRNGGVRAAIVLGHDVLADLGGADALAELDALIVLDTHQSELHRVAHVLFPTRHAAERRGTYTNVAGRVQRTTPAVEPAFEAYLEGDVLDRLGAALGLEGFGGGFDPSRASREISQTVSAFRGVDLGSVGDGGLLLAGAPSGSDEESA